MVYFKMENSRYFLFKVNGFKVIVVGFC